MISSANRIYSEFVQTEAPRQVTIARKNCTRSNFANIHGEGRSRTWSYSISLVILCGGIKLCIWVFYVVKPAEWQLECTRAHYGQRWWKGRVTMRHPWGKFVWFQINIDCGTRENITKNISQPTLTSFDTAQKLIYSLMARDCYPRFLKSNVYQGLLRSAALRWLFYNDALGDGLTQKKKISSQTLIYCSALCFPGG